MRRYNRTFKSEEEVIDTLEVELINSDEKIIKDELATPNLEINDLKLLIDELNTLYLDLLDLLTIGEETTNNAKPSGNTKPS